jgi:MYXO-CTERM domain-containing protein
MERRNTMSRNWVRRATAPALAVGAVVGATGVAQAAPPAYQTSVLANNPYAYYRQNESTGTAAADASGNGHAATYNGAPALGAPGAGGAASDAAVSYDGANNRYLSADINSFGALVGTSSYEFVFKVNPGAAQTRQSLFGVYTAGANLPDVNIDLNSFGNDAVGDRPGSTRLFVRGNNADANSGASIAAHFTNTALYDGNYHHLVMTYNDAATGVDAFAAYVDGVAQDMTFSQVNGTLEPAGFSDFDLPAAFAARNVRGSGADPIGREANVTLDELALYGSVLSPSQVAANFAATAIPEPAGLTLLAVTALTLTRRRRKA